MNTSPPETWTPITEKELAEVDIEQIRDLLKLTPEQRLKRHEGARQLVIKLREAGKAYYGFDPAIVAQAPTRTS